MSASTHVLVPRATVSRLVELALLVQDRSPEEQAALDEAIEACGIEELLG